MSAHVLITGVIAIALGVMGWGQMPVSDAGGLPHMAGTLPPVETALLQALTKAGLTDRLVHVGADTNGHLTVASLVFTYQPTDPDLLRNLQDYAWNLLKTAYGAVPTLDEVDLTAFHQDASLPPLFNRRDVTFSAAVSRQDLARISAGASGSTALRQLPRVWFHPLLLSPEARGSQLNQHGQRIQPGPPPREQLLKFSGSVHEVRGEAEHVRTGHLTGRIVEGKLYRGDPTRRLLALTFDDGPTPIYTTLLLDTLRQLQVKATFFVVGLRVEQYPYFAQAIVAEGHEIANHSLQHLNLTRLTPPEILDDLARTQETITRVTGVTPQYFRPPGGDYNAAVLDATRRLSLGTVFWTDDPADYARPDPRVLEARLLVRVSSGGILLLHQGVSETVHILPQITAILRRLGYGLTTVGGLLSPQPLRPKHTG